MNEQELIELARQEGESVRNFRDDKSNLPKFIREFNITTGDIKVPNYLIYYVYRISWRPQGKKMSKIEFMRRLSKVFDQKRTGKVRYYMLNHNPFEDYDLRKVKIYDKKYGNQKKVKIKKGKRKVSKHQERVHDES